MIRHITTPHLLTFFQKNLPMQPLHNHAFHLEVVVHKNKFNRVLVDVGVGLNIFTLYLIKNLGYSDGGIEKEKSYHYKDIQLSRTCFSRHNQAPYPSRIGVIVETTIEVIELDLPYNILLGFPWIHAMQVVASTYHQCIKFLYEDKEVTIHANPKPFYYYKKLE